MHVLILHSYHSTTEQGSAWHAVSEDRKLKQMQAHGIKSGEFAVLGFFWLHRKQCKQCQRESAEWGENTAGKSAVMNSLCIYKDRVRGCPSKLDQYPAADQAIEDRSLKTDTSYIQIHCKNNETPKVLSCTSQRNRNVWFISL